MKKQKLSLLILVVFGLLLFPFFVNYANAGASATVSWVAPTTNTDTSTLTDLAGFKVFYSTSSNTCPVYSSSGVDVPSATATSKFINDSLTPGQTYYFTVMAYDSSGNYSTCGTANGSSNTYVSKLVSYTGDLNYDGSVDALDYSYIHSYYGTSNATADINHDGTVDSLDYAYIHAEYNSTPLTLH